MNQNTQTVKRMKEASQSRKQVIYHTMKTALISFILIRRKLRWYASEVQKPEKEREFKQAVREGFKSEGVAFPAGGTVRPYDTVTGTLTWNPKFSPVQPSDFNVKHELPISDREIEYLTTLSYARGIPMTEVITNRHTYEAWERVKQRLSIPTIEEIEENHLRRMSNEEVKKEYCNDARGEAQRSYDERVKKVKQDFAPINDFLKSVNKPELPIIMFMSGQRAGKTLIMKKHIKDCISTDCCGKCEKDKPE